MCNCDKLISKAMLFINYDFVFSYVFHNMTKHYMFHNHAAYTYAGCLGEILQFHMRKQKSAWQQQHLIY